METNGLFSGVLGLQMPLHPTQNSQKQQNPHHLHHQSQMIAYAHHDPDHHHPHPHQSVKQGYQFAQKSKQIVLSDDDEPGFGADDNDENKKKMSPWQRMRWTDSMVRLLIMAVFYIGDDGGSDGLDPTGKKKSAGGLLQKKGKWKSVSRAMQEKGFYVSPQQCEDKFNDLNKRYKRVNDILGKGTACRVVENQELLEKMELSPKLKEEVRKLLHSKHLFFREMCAYHNSCGHGTVGGASHNSPPEVAAEPAEVQVIQSPPQQQRCFHSSENAHVVANSGRSETKGSKMVNGGSGGDDEAEDYEDLDSEDDDDDNEEEVIGGGSRGLIRHRHHEDDDDNDERASFKRPRNGGCFPGPSSTQLMQKLNCEVRGMLQDVTKSPWEKKQWLKTRLIQLEEEQVNFQYQAFELEKQRLKWVKFSGKKERDMERAKLENERSRLENERMLLLVRRKELEVLEFHQQQHQNSSSKRSDLSSLAG